MLAYDIRQLCRETSLAIELVGNVLFRDPAPDVLVLHLLDELDGVVGYGVQGTHHTAILRGYS